MLVVSEADILSAMTGSLAVIRIIAGLAISALALYFAWHFPVFARELTAGLLFYLILLLIFPAAWLVVVPAAIPLLDLGLWSGRLYFAEFDFLLMATFGGVLMRRGFTLRGLGATGVALLALLVIYNAFVTYNGLLPIISGGLGEWNDQLSSLNSIRETKGFFAALLLLPLLLAERDRGVDIARLFCAGMIAGLLAVSATIIWERGLFTGLFNFSDAYRVSGWFIGMLTGGAAIDAYLIMVTPFIGALILLYPRNAFAWIAAFMLSGLAAYSLFVTYSRANYPAVLAMFSVFAVGTGIIWRRRLEFRFSYALALVLLVIVGGGASYKLAAGGNIEKRFEQAAQDLQTRFDHWSDVMRIVNYDRDAKWTGVGRGVFPLKYYFDRFGLRKPLVAPVLTHSDTDSYMTFTPGSDAGTMFLRQRFTPTQDGRYRLVIELRAPEDKRERILIEFCERHILKYLAECNWVGINVKNPAGQWIDYNKPVDLRALGEARFGPFQRPFDISVMGRGIRERIDIRSVSLYSSDGSQLLGNTHFRDGMDRWFISYGNHLRWHIKNVLGYFYFEGGVLGLMVFALTIALVGYRLSHRIVARDPFAVILASAIAGVLFVGVFDSLFDDPRIAFLFTLLIWLSLLKPVEVVANPSGSNRE